MATVAGSDAAQGGAATRSEPVSAKQAIFDYCRKRGALAVGVADLAALERIAPPGHRPSDLTCVPGSTRLRSRNWSPILPNAGLRR